MRFAKAYLSILLVWYNPTVRGAACPGSMGDSYCKTLTGPSGFCVLGSWTCSDTSTPCGCSFTGSIAVPPVATAAATLPAAKSTSTTTTTVPTTSLRRLSTSTSAKATAVAAATASNCPGAQGNSFCQGITGSSGFCVLGSWVCSGTQRSCGCDFSSSGSIPPSIPAPPTNPPAVPTAAPVTPSTPPPIPAATTLQPAPPAACGSTPSRPLFVWTEWPELYSASEWSSFFSKLLGFIRGNCGNFAVTRVILRVLNPTVAGLWTVSTSSALYTNFLSQLPPKIQLELYPYLLDSNSQSAWASVSPSGSKPLEGVFAYAQQWNSLLASSGVSARFVGVTLDGEEKVGFASEIGSVAQYKSQYGVARFAVAIGYDSFGSMAQYPAADAFYMEMYDFYVNNAASLTLVQVNPDNDSPATFLNQVAAESLTPFVAKYADPRMQFMWSVQRKSGGSCLYPLDTGCGSSDDFGWFNAPDFSIFLQLLANRFPVFAGRDHGLFQFDFIPPSWM